MAPTLTIHRPSLGSGRRAVFLDRDGVLIENRDQYVRREADIEPLPGTGAAVRRLVEAGFVPVVVTNQACVGRGLVDHDEVVRLHGLSLRAAGVDDLVAASVICPHHPDDGCGCRKPLSGMLLAAGEALGLDIAGSYLVGDAVTDLRAGLGAGATPILVRTGRGAREEEKVDADLRRRCLFADDVSGASDRILEHCKGL